MSFRNLKVDLKNIYQYIFYKVQKKLNQLTILFRYRYICNKTFFLIKRVTHKIQYSGEGQEEG